MNNLEIYLKDTNSDPNKTLKSALELKEMGVKTVSYTHLRAHET